MQITITGYVGGKPADFTYTLSDESVAEAIADVKEWRFTLSAELNPEQHYALVDADGEFYGELVPPEGRRAALGSLPKHEWQPGQRLAVHCATELDSKVGD